MHHKFVAIVLAITVVVGLELTILTNGANAGQNIDGYVEHLGEGHIEVSNIPILYSLCGLPLVLSEPLENGKTHIYEGVDAIEKRINEYIDMEQPILTTELSGGIFSCEMSSPSPAPENQQFPDFSNKSRKYHI